MIHHVQWSFHAVVGFTWMRVVEAFVKAGAFACVAIVEVLLASRKDNCMGLQRSVYAMFWWAMSIQSCIVAVSLRYGNLPDVAHPIIGSWGAFVMLMSWVYAIYRVGEFPEKVAMLALHSRTVEVAGTKENCHGVA